MRDFTLKTYEKFLTTFVKNHYQVVTVKDYFANDYTNQKVLILKHDVDKLPENACQMAVLEDKIGIKGTYYFRAVPYVFDIAVIKNIFELGHEVGYHYENLSHKKGNLKEAIVDFKMNLETFRQVCSIDTIAMHGSPFFKWDNKDIWKDFDLKDFDILCDPYLDKKFKKICYFTDTGRRWDGCRVSRRDKIHGVLPNIHIHNTEQFIETIGNNKSPNHLMLTIHPQRWTNNVGLWAKELFLQSVKNQIKRGLIIWDKRS